MPEVSPVTDSRMADPGHNPNRAEVLFWLGLVGIVLAAITALWLFSYAIMPGPNVDAGQAGDVVELVIPPDSGLQWIRMILAEHGVIADDLRFSLLAGVMRVSKRLRAGEYRLAYGRTPYQVLRILADGRVLYRPVTIPEGADINRVADILAAGGWVDRSRLLELITHPDRLAGLSLPVASLEGYLFPDTYFLSKGQLDEASILRMLVNRALAVFDQASAAVGGAPPGLSRHDIMTLASIVEKETGRADERPLIARVFLNRLAKGMRLQADPTAIYGRPGGKHGPVTSQDLRNPSPYNTYLIDGLPPGPICNPGRAAIEAVLRPADNDYLYFVAQKDSTHHFARTLAEHNRAVARLRAEKAASGQ